VSLPGSDGYLLDDRLYPIGTIELQGAPRICQDCVFVGAAPSLGVAIFSAGPRLLAAALDGGAVTELANDVGTSAGAMVQVSVAAPPGTGCWVVYTTGGSTLQSVPCAGGSVLSITRLAPGSRPQLGPLGSTLVASGSDGAVWFADLEGRQARPVFSGGYLSYYDLGAAHAGMYSPGTGEVASVSFVDGAVAVLGRWISHWKRASAGNWIAILEASGPGYGDRAVAVGPPGGPTIPIVASDQGIGLVSWGFSTDGTSIFVMYWDNATQAFILTVARSSDGAILWTTSGVRLAFGFQWSPDSTRLVWPSTSGMRLTDLTGSSISLSNCAGVDFTPDGRYLACQGLTSPGPTSIYEVASGTLVGASSAPIDPRWIYALPDSSAFWFSDCKSTFHRLGVDGSFTAVADAGGIYEPARPSGGRWITYRSTDLTTWKALSTDGGGRPIELNPPDLVPVGWYDRMVPPTDAFVFASGGNVYVTPPGGGAPWLVGSTLVGPRDGSPAAIAPDGLSISTVGPDRALRSAWLPDGPSSVDATGVYYVEYIGGGRLAGSYEVGSASFVGPPVGPLTSLGPYRNVDRQLGPDGRMVFQAYTGDILSVRVADADVISLASCAVAAFPEAAAHGDRVTFKCGGVIHSVPILGGPASPSVRLDRGRFTWIDDRHLAATRVEAPPPYRFQNGLYLVTVP
jgi:hypothetical protein